MVSGLKPDQNIQNRYMDLSINRTIKCMIIKIEKNDRKEDIMSIESAFDHKNFLHEHLLNALPAKEGRFALLNFECDTNENRLLEKIVLILWAPFQAKPFNKMLYTSSCKSLEENLPAIAKVIQASEVKEITFEAIKNELIK